MISRREQRRRRRQRRRIVFSVLFLFAIAFVAVRMILLPPIDLPPHRGISLFQIFLVAPRVRSIWEPSDLEKRRRDAMVAYFTFDDGPDPRVTPKIVAVLNRTGVRGTFFVLGNNVKHFPDVVRLCYREGNAIGNHSYGHEYRKIYSSTRAYLQSLERCNEEIEKAIGVRTHINRPPGGAFNWITQKKNSSAVHQAGYKIFNWNVECRDGMGRPSSAEIVENVLKEVKRLGKHRAIILGHDRDRNLPQALPLIILRLKRMGYKFGILDENVTEMK